MKLIELKLERIYHSTAANFKKFQARPTWFALNEKDAHGWHANGALDHDKQITYICTYDGTKIKY